MANHEAKPTVTEPEQPLWRYISYHQFTRPQPSAREKVRKGFLGLWGQLWNRSQPDQTQPPHPELRHLSHSLQDRIAPVPDWSVLCQALDEALLPWLDGGVSSVRQQIIGGPYSGAGEALSDWATTRDLFFCSLRPGPRIYGSGNAPGWTIFPNPAALLVLPSLEQCYLRHT
ncbi:MAG: hypothetical protein R3F37_14485 [Candidatus Competibacteraceae bacterium]